VFSHIGWILLKPHTKVKNAVKECYADDLKDDLLLEWQESNYYELYLLTAIFFPSILAGYLWDDYIGGLIYVGILRGALVQQCTFLVNSMGHLIGTQCYDDRKSHKNNFFLALLSWGEGYNNFHHEFSADYRNGYNWYEFDPIKYHLFLLSKIGLVKVLNRTSDSSVSQCLIQFQQKLIDKRRAKLNWGISISQLPIITPEEFRKLAKEEAPERALIAVSGIVHDVTPFMYDHPGGVTLIKTSIGKDATSAFNGAVYDHTTAAHNLLATMRIAVLSGGTEQIVWKQEQKENKDVPLKQSSGQKIVRTGEQATITQKTIRTAGAA
jgi:stearoyl-CoA desaturase (delta-9 desaturase)